MKHLRNLKAKKLAEAFGALFSLMCVCSIKGGTIYRRPPGMIIYLNYTFSVPDKRLYTLYKGITVTLRVVQASACLRTAKPPLHAAHLVSASYDTPLHVCCSYVSWHHLDGAKDHRSRRAFGAEPAHDSA
jgi:hypothetical protein